MVVSVDEVLDASREQKIEFLREAISAEEFIFVDLLPVLNQLARDEDAQVRELAVTALWDYPEPEVIDLLFELVEKDPVLRVRTKAVVTLGRFIYEGEMESYDDGWIVDNTILPELPGLSEKDFLRVKRYLLALVRNEKQPLELRRFAIESLSFLTEPAVVDIIRKAYEHPDPKMKVSALFSMGRNNNEIWADILLKELESPVPELQFEATRAAGEFGLREGARILERLAKSNNKDLALEAIWALGKTGGTGVGSFLERLTRDKDPDVKEIAEAALSELEMVDADDDLDLEDVDWEDEDS